jgi:hypothetical protein
MHIVPLANKAIFGHVLAHRRNPNAIGEFNVADG